MDDAYICALDAEWEPYTPKPSASLVQAAVRTRTHAEQHVLLLVRAGARAHLTDIQCCTCELDVQQMLNVDNGFHICPD